MASLCSALRAVTRGSLSRVIAELRLLDEGKALSQATQIFLCAHFSQVLRSPEFLNQVSAAQWAVLLRLNELDADEFDIFQALVQWAEATLRARQCDCGPQNVRTLLVNCGLLHLVRFPVMRRRVLAGPVMKMGVLLDDELLNVFTFIGTRGTPAEIASLFPTVPRFGAYTRLAAAGLELRALEDKIFARYASIHVFLNAGVEPFAALAWLSVCLVLVRLLEPLGLRFAWAWTLVPLALSLALLAVCLMVNSYHLSRDRHRHLPYPPTPGLWLPMVHANAYHGRGGLFRAFIASYVQSSSLTSMGITLILGTVFLSLELMLALLSVGMERDWPPVAMASPVWLALGCVIVFLLSRSGNGAAACITFMLGGFLTLMPVLRASGFTVPLYGLFAPAMLLATVLFFAAAFQFVRMRASPHFYDLMRVGSLDAFMLLLVLWDSRPDVLPSLLVPLCVAGAVQIWLAYDAAQSIKAQLSVLELDMSTIPRQPLVPIPTPDEFILDCLRE